MSVIPKGERKRNVTQCQIDGSRSKSFMKKSVGKIQSLTGQKVREKKKKKVSVAIFRKRFCHRFNSEATTSFESYSKMGYTYATEI